ncbi:MAG TPA: carboxypeptidase-like regulatory domain-containing protein [Actinomycetota bacterium]
MTRRLSTGVWFLVSIAVLGFPSAAPGDTGIVCIPSVVESPADCTFNIWGYVHDAAGKPAVDVSVTGGTRDTRTDSNGFYDLYELQFGAHDVSAFRGQNCTSPIGEVYVSPDRAILDGGTRQDLTLPCVLD